MLMHTAQTYRQEMIVENESNVTKESTAKASVKSSRTASKSSTKVGRATLKSVVKTAMNPAARPADKTTAKATANADRTVGSMKSADSAGPGNPVRGKKPAKKATAKKSPAKKSAEKKAAVRKEAAKEPRLLRSHAPENLSRVEWQRGLRRQFGREQDFGLQNVGHEPFFSEFKVSNPDSGSAYRVVIRGLNPGDNYCACPDYATNELGTCKHIEFTLFSLQKKRGAKTAFARGYHPPFSEIYLRHATALSSQRAVHFRTGTDCPDVIRKLAAVLFDEQADGRMRDIEIRDLERFMALATQAEHDLRVYDDALDFLAGQRDARRRHEQLQKLFPDGPNDARLRKLLKVPLYPYQAEGALFAVRAGRALIGDEMGLGKTIQAIAAAEILIRHFGALKVLVICPTSLAYQWQSEIARFTGRDPGQSVGGIRVMSGARTRREQEYPIEDLYKITNYEKLKLDQDLITQWSPDLVIVDEAQRIKNWNTLAARSLKRIDSPYAVVLTGTPLENKLEELISIVQFVDQHRLGPTWKLLNEHQVRDEAGRVTGYTGLERIGQTLAPIMIRRRKADVLTQLPERTDTNLLVPMTEAQMACHQENENVVNRIVHRWRKLRFLTDTDQRRLMSALQNMRMACVSTYLLDDASDHGVKADELTQIFERLFESDDTKAVVFSQWLGTQEILARRLDASGIGYVRFHGQVPSDQRGDLINRFKNDPQCRVFLASDAAATGMNLQFATTVVNMDLPWNPALMEQRIARIHRMGQQRPIQVINLISKGTIEEGMLSRLAFKRSLAAGILDGASGEISLGGSRLNRFMKDIEAVTEGKYQAAQAGHAGQADLMTPQEEASGVMAAASEADHSGEDGARQRVQDDVAIRAEDKVDTVRKASADAGDDANNDGQRIPGSTQPESAVPDTEVLQDGQTMIADPWQAFAQVGSELVSALTAASDPRKSHPWIERDQSGRQSLRLPLPSPEVSRQMADVLSMLASALRRP